MPDPYLFGQPPESTQYRVGTVLCPHNATTAEIVAASWTTRGNRWTPWNVVDCSLMPAGFIFCDGSCLSQLESAEAAQRA